MNNTTSLEIPKRPQRFFIPEQFELKDWNTLEPYLQELQNRPINSAAELEKWMLDRSELESIFGEEIGWRYIRMTINTQDETATEAFQYFVTEIEPKVAPYDHALNQKLMESPYLPELDQEKYRIYLRSVRRQLEIFREENIPLKTEITTRQQQDAAITGAMTGTLDGQEMTSQRAADREIRSAWSIGTRTRLRIVGGRGRAYASRSQVAVPSRASRRGVVASG